MKRWALVLTCAVLSVACSDESKVEDAATAAATARLEKKVTDEAEARIGDRPLIKKIFVSTMMSRAEFEIVKTDVAAPNASADVRVKTVPPAARFALLEILANHDKAMDNAINVAEVLKGVLQNLKLKAEDKTETVEHFTLTKNDGWKVNDAP